MNIDTETFPVLETKRLVLRQVTQEDAASVFSVLIFVRKNTNQI